MMAVQEPPPGTEANCQFVYFSKAGDIKAPFQKSTPVSLVALYSIRHLKPGEELFVHYGKRTRNATTRSACPVQSCTSTRYRAWSTQVSGCLMQLQGLMAIALRSRSMEYESHDHTCAASIYDSPRCESRERQSHRITPHAYRVA